MIFTKNSKAFALPVVVIIVVFLLTGCSSDSAAPLSTTQYDVNFKVVDKTDSEAVEGAKINLAGEKKVTNDEGLASFKKENGNYDYNIEATGYIELKDKIIVNDENTFKNLELEILISSDINEEEDENDNGNIIPGEDTTPPDDSGSDDNGESPPEEDTIHPSFQNLYAFIGDRIYQVLDIDINKIIEESDIKCDYVILKFSEPVKCIDLDKNNDFKIQVSDFDSVEDTKIFEITHINSYPEYLVIEIEVLAENWKAITVTINESGRQKIFDLADNSLSKTPDFLKIPIL